MELIGPRIYVPANASRLFKNFEHSTSQPEGIIQLAWSKEKPYLYNSSYNSTVTIYDKNYCTVDPFHFTKSQSYFEKLVPLLTAYDAYIEIGCGQGEFVESMRARGLNAFGFDPVLRAPTQFLIDELWTLSSEEDLLKSLGNYTPLYVMRCVLPHIPEPFQFLDLIFENHPDGAVLLEFQKREWIADNKVWPQISHDHVNIFSESDFSQNYTIVSSGSFSDDEWLYVLLKRRSRSSKMEIENLQEIAEFSEIFSIRDTEISMLVNLERPIAIYGAAGKGIVLAHSLKKRGINEIFALDSDSSRHGLFMECSGVYVIENKDEVELLKSNVLVLVANPNHLSFVKNRYPNLQIACVGSLGGIADDYFK